jgi:sporulation protein YlmC with PRC-barrel domain
VVGSEIAVKRNDLRVSREPSSAFVMTISDLTMCDVRNHRSEQLGRVEDLMLDPGSGQVRYALLSSVNRLGMGYRLILVPWGFLVIDASNRCLKLNMVADRFDAAPSFREDQYQGLANRNWLMRVEAYFRCWVQASGQLSATTSRCGSQVPKALA